MHVTDDTPHSSIGASSMYRWSKCPGSVKLGDMADDEKSSAPAILGTIAHEVAEIYLTTGVWPDAAKYGMSEGEMKAVVTGVKVYTDYVQSIKNSEPNSIHHIEHGFDMHMVHPGAYGTADFVSYNPDTKRLRVADYKNGKGLVVEVFNNPQLLYYALGAALTLKYPFRTLELVVVQPRAFHSSGSIRSWVVGPETLWDFRADLIDAAKRTEKPNAPYAAGSHCFFCKGMSLCPIKDKAMAAKKGVFMAPKMDAVDDFKPVQR